MHSLFQKTKVWIIAHKVASAVIVVILVGGGYYLSKTQTGVAVTTYTLTTVQKGTVITTVTGSGQVSANNQADIPAQVSGTVDSIPVSVGQSVTAGQTLVHINSLTAANSLQSAQLSYAQLTEAAKSGDVTSNQNAVMKAYSGGWSAAASAMTDMLNLKNNFYSDIYGSSGFISNNGSNANFIHTSQTGQNYWSTIDTDYGRAVNAYDAAFSAYQGSSPSEATSSIVDLLNKSSAAAAAFSLLAKDAANFGNFISNQNTSNTNSRSTDATTAVNNLQSWLSTANSDVSSVQSAQNAIQTAENSLATLLQGADSLQVQASALSLSQAKQNFNYTYVTAPFAGIVAKIDVANAQQINSGTTVASVVTPGEYATISLNEVDAAKVAVGQKATLTFDAFSDLSIAGTVSEVDGIGAVSQGVVTYGVKISFDTNDARVKPGMSVNATIMTAVHNDVLVVPSSAVKTQGSASYVQELGQKYTAAQMAGSVTSATAPTNVPVAVGLSDNTNTEIVSGLSAGDEVIAKTSVSSGTGAKTTATAATTRTGGGGGFGGGGGAAVLRGL